MNKTQLKNYILLKGLKMNLTKTTIYFFIGLTLTSKVFAETSIPNYGYYHYNNEISAKDEIKDDVSNIFDFENSPNARGEKIEKGKYYFDIKYKGVQDKNGVDTDYIYLKDIIGKDGVNGKDGEDGKKGDTGKQGVKGDTGKQGVQGVQGKGLEDRKELILEGRVWDSKKTSGFIYGGYDVNNDVSIVGVKVQIKLGKSYEEKRIEELENLIKEYIPPKTEVEKSGDIYLTDNGFGIKNKF